ncbi:MAG: hypothetical protein U9Q67_03880 [Patescibacteria group bacterium]|nr:hypothetical protein [Patescibacteria group bacterium]
MIRQPKKNKKPILIILGVTLLLAIGGTGLVFLITRAKDVEPEIAEATSCCRCTWKSSSDDTTVAIASGTGQSAHCSFPEDIFIDGERQNQCDNIEIDEDTTLEADSTETACGTGCVSFSSNPILPPTIITEDNNDVEFYADFKMYVIDDEDKYTGAKMSLEYPDIDESPDSIEIDFEEDEDAVQVFTLTENNMDTIIYRVTFETTWDVLVDPDTHGLYKAMFRAKDQDGHWSDYGYCTRTIDIASDIELGKNYCVNIDIAQAGGTGTQNVTLQAITTRTLSSEDGGSYTWSLDMNCDGSIDEVTEIIESTSAEISQDFEFPADETGYVECPVSVVVNLQDGTSLDEYSENSCSDEVVLSQAPLTCGNGACDGIETCDTDGNIGCPGGLALDSGVTCREDCTYCGDGVLDPGQGELCDPEIEEGQAGYNANCLADCTIAEITDDDGDDTPDEFANSLTIIQQAPACLEMVSPNNQGTFTITVTNSGTTAGLVRAVSDTLPQGFSYNTGTSIINSTAISGDTGIVVENSGSSQLITWNNSDAGWQLTGGQSLTIQFTATAGANATTGTQTNTVTVTPSNDIPLSSTYDLLVAQVCTQPETGIFDSSFVAIIIGSILLLIAGVAYYTGIGTGRTVMLLEYASNAKDSLVLILTRPQKYMEKRIESSALKQIKSLGHKRKKK